MSVFTLFQTNGKGQGNHKWISEPGKNLAYTIALPLPDLINFVDLNKTLTLSVCNLVQNYLQPQVTIKWPNDIFCLNKKIGGLLFQVQNVQNQKYLILGIGINANQTNWPLDLPHASSLATFGVQNIDLFELTNQLTENLSADFEAMIAFTTSKIASHFQSKLYCLNQTIQIISTANQEILSVKLINVDDLGRIIVEDQQGNLLSYHHGQVHILL